MTDLSTTYLGLSLKNPLVASASPLSKKLDSVHRLEDAGIGAIVMHSLFEEQVIHDSLELDHFLNQGSDISAEATSSLPDGGVYSIGPGKYLDHLTAIKKSVSVPVIASLNGVSNGGWTRYARHMQDAGADALELNLYYLAADVSLTGQELENSYVDLVSEIRSTVKIPLAIKLSPFITSLPNFVKRLGEVGANGIVLFNRFYQPDLDLENLEVIHDLKLSTSDDLRLPLRWISILYGKVETDLAITGGVHDHLDVLKSMMVGAKAAMLASELLQNGYKRIPEILTALQVWMQVHEYHSIQQMQGSMSQKSVAEPAAFERSNYMRVLNSYRDLP